MLKHLNVYYIYIVTPFALLLGGAAFFFKGILGTVVNNPQPEILYVIFAIILFGGCFIIVAAYKLIMEARVLKQYCDLIHAKNDWSTIQQVAGNFVGDISYILQMVSSTGGRPISHQEQTAIEHEHTSAKNHLFHRNALPNYLSGLLVGMGLLGTFIGLLSTLNDITILISTFAEIDMATASPLQVFRIMIERMQAPMHSMSIAFSSSMYGLLGSITLGLMMLGIRRIQGDITSVLGSEIARHIEIALSYEGTTVEPVKGGGGSDDAKVLSRIEARLAEAARTQQRALNSEIADFQKQRADMLRALTEQTEASNKFRNELQQLGRQFESVITLMEKGNVEMFSRISDLTVTVAGDAKESHKLLAMQIEEQKRLRESLDSCKVEERLAESARMQQRTLSAEIADFQKQRADMVRTLSEQTESSNGFRSELQQLGRQIDTLVDSLENGNDEIATRISELIVHMAADAKESQNLLAMQVNEQKRLIDVLDWRSNGSAGDK